MGVSTVGSLHERAEQRGLTTMLLRRVRCGTLVALAGCGIALAAPGSVARAYSPPQAAMVVDGYSGKVLYASNADETRYPASISKVMTLYLLFEQIRDGKMDLDTKLKVSAEAASRPPSKIGLEPGSTISVKDAMHLLVTKSANDVAAVVAENIGGSEPAFARMMTQKARQLGMTRTTFRNASGLPDSKQVSTARDLITLGRRMLTDFPKYADVFNTRQYSYGKRTFRNHNRLLFSYRGMEGLKTGFIRASGFNLLGSCRRDGKFLIAVVLGGKSGKARNLRMQQLLDRSWSKAVTLKDFKAGNPIAISGIVEEEYLPERNPAFHDIWPDEGVRLAAAGDPVAADPAGDLVEESTEEPLEIVIAETASESVDEAMDESRAEGSKTASIEPAGPYHVQVGSFLSPDLAESHLVDVSSKAPAMLRGHSGHTVRGEVKGKLYYRARYGEFTEAKAATTCAALKKMKVDCLVVRVE